MGVVWDYHLRWKRAGMACAMHIIRLGLSMREIERKGGVNNVVIKKLFNASFFLVQRER